MNVKKHALHALHDGVHKRQPRNPLIVDCTCQHGGDDVTSFLYRTLTGRLRDVQSYDEFQADNWQKSGFKCTSRHGTAVCSPCGPGYYQADDFTPYCKQCPPGMTSVLP